MKINTSAVLTFLLFECVLVVEVFCGRSERFQGAKDDKNTPRQSASKHTRILPNGLPKDSSTMGPRPDIKEWNGSGETVVEEEDPHIGVFENVQKIGSNYNNMVYSFENKDGSDESGCLGCDDELSKKTTDSLRKDSRTVETGTELPVTHPPSRENKDVFNTVFKIAGVVGGLCFLVLLMNCIQVIVIVTHFKKRSSNRFETDEQGRDMPKTIVTKPTNTHEEHSMVEVGLNTTYLDDSGDSSKDMIPETPVDSNKVCGQEEQPIVTTTAVVLNLQTDNSMKDGDHQNSETLSDSNVKPGQQIPSGSTDIAVDLPLTPPPEVMPVTNHESSGLVTVTLADITMTDPLNTIQLDVDEVIGQQRPAIRSSLAEEKDEKHTNEDEIAREVKTDVLPQTADPTYPTIESLPPPMSYL